VDESGNYAWHFSGAIQCSNGHLHLYLSGFDSAQRQGADFDTGVPMYAAHPSTLRPWFYLTIILPKTSVGRFLAHQ
jgi:hypothetical protein